MAMGTKDFPSEMVFAYPTHLSSVHYQCEGKLRKHRRGLRLKHRKTSAVWITSVWWVVSWGPSSPVTTGSAWLLGSKGSHLNCWHAAPAGAGSKLSEEFTGFPFDHIHVEFHSSWSKITDWILTSFFVLFQVYLLIFVCLYRIRKRNTHTHIYIYNYILIPKESQSSFFVAVDDSISRYGFREHIPRFPIFDSKSHGFPVDSSEIKLVSLERKHTSNTNMAISKGKSSSDIFRTIFWNSVVIFHHRLSFIWTFR